MRQYWLCPVATDDRNPNNPSLMHHSQPSNNIPHIHQQVSTTLHLSTYVHFYKKKFAVIRVVLNIVTTQKRNKDLVEIFAFNQI